MWTSVSVCELGLRSASEMASKLESAPAGLVSRWKMEWRLALELAGLEMELTSELETELPWESVSRGVASAKEMKREPDR